MTSTSTTQAEEMKLKLLHNMRDASRLQMKVRGITSISLILTPEEWTMFEKIMTVHKSQIDQKAADDAGRTITLGDIRELLPEPWKSVLTSMLIFSNWRVRVLTELESRRTLAAAPAHVEHVA